MGTYFHFVPRLQPCQIAEASSLRIGRKDDGDAKSQLALALTVPVRVRDELDVHLRHECRIILFLAKNPSVLSVLASVLNY